jgi:hypothetical protein
VKWAPNPVVFAAASLRTQATKTGTSGRIPADLATPNLASQRSSVSALMLATRRSRTSGVRHLAKRRKSQYGFAVSRTAFFCWSTMHEDSGWLRSIWAPAADSYLYWTLTAVIRNWTRRRTYISFPGERWRFVATALVHTLRYYCGGLHQSVAYYGNQLTALGPKRHEAL